MPHSAGILLLTLAALVAGSVDGGSSEQPITDLAFIELARASNAGYSIFPGTVSSRFCWMRGVRVVARPQPKGIGMMLKPTRWRGTCSTSVSRSETGDRVVSFSESGGAHFGPSGRHTWRLLVRAEGTLSGDCSLGDRAPQDGWEGVPPTPCPF